MFRNVRFFVFASVPALLAGCSGVSSALGGLAEKALSGSGTVAIQHVGVDPDTAAPVLKSTIITGDYASAPEGTYALQYRRRIAPSIFNASAVSHEVTINYIGTADRLADAVGLVRSDFESEQPEYADQPDLADQPERMDQPDLADEPVPVASED